MAGAAPDALPAAESLLDEARARTGIGLIDEPAQAPLRMLLESLNGEGGLHPAGVRAMHGRLLRLLSNRLRMRRDLQAHPEILDQPLRAPIFICGMARTGSTKTQKLLAASGDFNWLPYWQVLNPALLSGERGESPQPRIDDTEDFARWFDRASPETRAGHPFETHEPEEESFILEHSLKTPTFMGWAPINGYLQWLFTQDLTAQFEQLRDTLKYLQWQGLAQASRRWILKSPLYSGLEPLLLKVFPDACLVMTHRHPLVTIPSGLRLLECFYKPFSTLRPDPASYVAGQAAAAAAHLAFRGAAAPDRFLDLNFRALVQDVAAAMTGIYRHASVALQPESLRRILAWNAAHPQYRDGRHEYSLARFGLDPPQIERAFAGYVDFLEQRFGAGAVI